MNDYNSEHPDMLPSSKPSVDANEPAKPARASKAALYIAYLALFFTAVGITVGYKHWLRIHDKAKVALAEIQTIKTKLDGAAEQSSIDALQEQLQSTSAEAEKKLSDSILELDQIREQTTYSARSVSKQIEELTQQQSAATPKFEASTELQLTEIEILLKAAQRRLEFDYDKKNAIKLMEAADQVLIEVASTELLPIREQLAHDIAKLQRFDLADTEELSANISALAKDIKPLTEIDKELPDESKVTLFSENDEESLSGKVKNYINRSVDIRKLPDSPRFTLNSNEKTQIDHLLGLRLESLRLMVMQRHDNEYHQLIQTIKSMLGHYYSPSVAEPWLEKLDKLDSINLTPELPDISSALKQLRKTTATDKS